MVLSRNYQRAFSNRHSKMMYYSFMARRTALRSMSWSIELVHFIDKNLACKLGFRDLYCSIYHRQLIRNSLMPLKRAGIRKHAQ